MQPERFREKKEALDAKGKKKDDLEEFNGYNESKR